MRIPKSSAILGCENMAKIIINRFDSFLSPSLRAIVNNFFTTKASRFKHQKLLRRFCCLHFDMKKFIATSNTQTAINIVMNSLPLEVNCFAFFSLIFFHVTRGLLQNYFTSSDLIPPLFSMNPHLTNDLPERRTKFRSYNKIMCR